MELRFCVKYWYGVYMKRVIFENAGITFFIIALIDFMLFLGPVYPEKVSFFSKYMIIFYGTLALIFSSIRYIYELSFIIYYGKRIAAIPLFFLLIYTYLYAYVGLPDRERLGAYYTLGVLFIGIAISLISLGNSKMCLKKASFFVLSLFSFYMIIWALLPLSYYFIYGTDIDLYALLGVMQTNMEEAKEYIATMVPQKIIVTGSIFLLISLIVCFGCAYRCFWKNENRNFSNSGLQNRRHSGAIILGIICCIGFAIESVHAIPYRVIRELQTVSENQELLEAFQGTYESKEVARKKISLLQDASIDKGTHIIVIGESANRDFMSLYTMNREENTTPWELSLLENPNVVRIKKAYSNFPNTVMALTYALTAKNQYNDMPLREAVNVVDAAHVSGYHTVWISTQTKGDIWGAANTAIAEHADEVYWETGYDEEVVKRLKQISLRKRQIIFIHLCGSHARYKDRIPPGFSIGSYFSDNVEYIDYKSTLLYTDQLLQDIFQYALENLQLQTMMYFSDHGEDMKYSHNPAVFSYDMVRIPFWIYMSPAYQKNHPDIMAHFRQNANKVFTNDLIFDTVSGLWGMKTNYYEPIYDFSSPSYALTDDGLTMHGKLRVKDDLNDGT